MIWRPGFTTTESEPAVLEKAGLFPIWDHPQVEAQRDFARAALSYEQHPYNWATREPMIWSGHRG